MGKGNPKGGAPRKEIDFDTLDNLVQIHCTAEECAGVLGISIETLNVRIKERAADEDNGDGGFLDLYKRLSPAGKASLRRLQWQAAERLNPTMLIWLGKQLLKQTDKVEHTGADGGPIQYEAIERRIIDLNDPSTWTIPADAPDPDAPGV